MRAARKRPPGPEPESRDLHKFTELKPKTPAGGVKASPTVDTSRARITIAPAKTDGRFAPDPDHRGVFSTMGPGRYLPKETA